MRCGGTASYAKVIEPFARACRADRAGAVEVALSRDRRIHGKAGGHLHHGGEAEIIRDPATVPRLQPGPLPAIIGDETWPLMLRKSIAGREIVVAL